MIKIKDGFHGERSFVFPQAVVRTLEEHPLSAALHITDIGYYPNALHHYRERVEPIDQYILIYCMKGNGWFETDGVRQKVSADDFFILPAGKPHRYATDDNENPWTIYWVHFKGSLAPYYATDLSVPVRITPNLKSRIVGRIQIFEEIMKTLGQGFQTDNLLFACSMFHHFLGTLRYIVTYRNLTDTCDNLDIVNAAVTFMNENIEKHLRLSDLSRFTGYSNSQFTHIFTKNTGMSPIAYFNMLKMRYACTLLATTDMKIHQVSYKLGISDMHYFSRLFSAVVGLSPTAWRLKNIRRL